MTKISIVSYINSLPFFIGLQQSTLDIEITEDIPSICADKLVNNLTDIGLVPVAALPMIPNYSIISDYGICSEKRVNSVFLFSNSPIDKIHTIYLDADSKTSNLLTKVLAKYHWKIQVDFELKKVENLKIGEAQVAIGDKTFDLINHFKHRLDLATEWFEFSKLPFVFAVWASNKNIDLNIKNELNQAFKYGVENRKSLIPELEKRFPKFDFEDYYFNCIQYKISANAYKGLNKFLEYSKSI